ncbi:Leucine--tRNA ligase [Gossypium arboreum]|uniref:Leucine--tRNA ligase n=1 Tax=Gossypium arboreum TaxID=29729 RepID=A0A0B0NUV9_GOSAR|nr:Leucine--tRNA ligase [Gossypium arboreum]
MHELVRWINFKAHTMKLLFRHIMRDSIRHVWDMHQPRDIQANARPIWDMASTSCVAVATKVARGSSPYVREASHTTLEEFGKDMTVCLSRMEDTAFGHGCACHGRVGNTCCRHGRVLGRVKTPVGSNLGFNSHGLEAQACPFMLRLCEPHGLSARPDQNGHTGVSSFHMGMNPDVATADDMESNAPALAKGTVPVDSGPVTMSQGGGAREAYLHMMDAWYSEFIHENPNTPPPPPPPIPQPIHIAHQGAEWLEERNLQ